MVILNRTPSPEPLEEEIFVSRSEAGKRLGSRLSSLVDENPLVLARPTRDMAVGAQIARTLDGQLDVFASKRLRSPANDKLSIGVLLENGITSLKSEIIRILDISPAHVEQERQRRQAQIQKEMDPLRKRHPRIPLKHRTVIVAVEGLLHGGNIKTRLKALNTANPETLILAVPMAPQITLRNLRPLVDEVVPLHEEAGYFHRIGDFYDHSIPPGEQTRLTFQDPPPGGTSS